MPLDIEKIKSDFPIFWNAHRNNKPLIYLDSGATSHKPQCVIDAESKFYSEDYGTVRRGIYFLSAMATEKYESVRRLIAEFIQATTPAEIVYTRGTTESINLVARCYGESQLKAGDEILLSEFEHHSNLVPWLMLRDRIGVKLVYVRSTRDWRFDMSDYADKLSERTKIVAVTGMSNVLGTMPDLKAITTLAHEQGAKVLIDGAQLVPHMGINVKFLDCDFLAFSSHKMLGPTGVGVLYVKRELGEMMSPWQGGGDMIESVQYDGYTTNELPYKFEAGTPNMAGVIGFGKAIEYINSVGLINIMMHERETTEYVLRRMLETDGMMLYGPTTAENRGSVFSFNYKDLHSHDIGSMLDFHNIAIRAGHHCAQPLMGKLGVISTARASFYLYNSKEDVNILIDALQQSERFLKNAVR